MLSHAMTAFLKTSLLRFGSGSLLKVGKQSVHGQGPASWVHVLNADMHLHTSQGYALLGAGGSEAACGLLGAAFDLLGGLAMDEAHPGFQEMSRAASLLSHRVRFRPVLHL